MYDVEVGIGGTELVSGNFAERKRWVLSA